MRLVKDSFFNIQRGSSDLLISSEFKGFRELLIVWHISLPFRNLMGSKCCKEGFKFVLEVNYVPLEPPFGFLPDFLSNDFCQSLSL